MYWIDYGWRVYKILLWWLINFIKEDIMHLAYKLWQSLRWHLLYTESERWSYLETAFHTKRNMNFTNYKTDFLCVLFSFLWWTFYANTCQGPITRHNINIVKVKQPHFYKFHNSLRKFRILKKIEKVALFVTDPSPR